MTTAARLDLGLASPRVVPHPCSELLSSRRQQGTQHGRLMPRPRQKRKSGLAAQGLCLGYLRSKQRGPVSQHRMVSHQNS